jgi:hypothetical protein
MLRCLTILSAVLIAVSPAAANEWPTSDTPMLELEAGGYTVSFPAPEWIDDARTFVDWKNDDNVAADWFTGGALLGGSPSTWPDWLFVQNVDLDHWYLLAQITFDHLGIGCEYLDVPNEGDGERALRVCRERLTGAGVIFYGVELFVHDRMFVVVYKITVAPLVLADETTWPMSRDELIAMADRIDGLITVTGPP